MRMKSQNQQTHPPWNRAIVASESKTLAVLDIKLTQNTSARLEPAQCNYTIWRWSFEWLEIGLAELSELK